MKEDFNHDWQFCKGDLPEGYSRGGSANWKRVILPHTWNVNDMTPGKENPYVGIAWYGKSFKVPRLKEGQRILIEFEAIAISSRIWVDGSYVGGRDGGFLGFWLDITDALAQGEEHIIAVKVNNSFNLDYPPPKHIDWERYGGIYRPAWLHIKNNAYFAYKGINIFTPEVSENKARIVVTSKCIDTRISGGKYVLRHTLLAPEGNVVCQTQRKIKIAYYHTVVKTIELPDLISPKLWSVERPTLYTLKTELLDENVLVDEVQNRIGFRHFSFDKDNGVSLNGKLVKLKGCDIHQDYPGLGSACPPRFQYEEMRLMKEMGCNFMRASHYPRNERCLNACDELGILVIEEQPLWHGSIRADQGEQFLHNAERMVTEMVEQHGNHPSIIIWNLANEVFLAPDFRRRKKHTKFDGSRTKRWKVERSEFPYIKRVLSSLYEAIKKADPCRPVSLVVGAKWQMNDDAKVTSIPDIVGYNGGVLNFKKEPYVDEDTKKEYYFLIDYFHEKYPERISIMTEGVINDKPCLRADWEKELINWENHARYWNKFYKRRWFSGGAMWCFTDYSSNGRLRVMGVMDISRLPLESYYFYKAMWSEKPTVHILCHWDWNKDEDRNVVVFTNCDEVELFLNGQRLEKGKSLKERWPYIPHPPVIWEEVRFAPGCLEARARAEDRVIVDRRQTSGAPLTVRIEADPFAICADGQDISYITTTVVDKDGNRCYNSYLPLNIKVEGSAYLSGEQRQVARGGIMKFAIRSTGERGKAVIEISGENLSIAKATVLCDRQPIHLGEERPARRQVLKD